MPFDIADMPPSSSPALDAAESTTLCHMGSAYATIAAAYHCGYVDSQGKGGDGGVVVRTETLVSDVEQIAAYFEQHVVPKLNLRGVGIAVIDMTHDGARVCFGLASEVRKLVEACDHFDTLVKLQEGISIPAGNLARGLLETPPCAFPMNVLVKWKNGHYYRLCFSTPPAPPL